MKMNSKFMREDTFRNRGAVPGKCLEMISVAGNVQVNIRHANVSRSLKFIANNY